MYYSTHHEHSKHAKLSTPCGASHMTFNGRCLNCGFGDPQSYCDIHAEEYTEFCQSCSDDEKAQYPIRLFVLSSGYVAVFSHISDILYWGSAVIPLAFGSEVSCHDAVERIRANNPGHLVTFSGGIHEYKALFAE